MKLKFKDDILVGLTVTGKFNWTKDSVSSLSIDWGYLKENYTSFQVKVWKELVKIPWGETRTYAQIAVKIGNANACRAVANACGSNPLALIIPCHRVVSTNGLGGYHWGVDAKKYLLEQENVSKSIVLL